MVSLSKIIENQQNEILKIYLSELSDPNQKNLLIKFLPDNLPKDQEKLRILVNDFLKIDKATQLTIAKHLARIADMQARVRNTVNSKLVANLADKSPIDAYSFRYTVKELFKNKLSPEELEKILNKSLISNSITAHPTNPYSVGYTAESINLDQILSEENSEEKSENLRAQIKKMIDIDPTSPTEENNGKKTQKEEVQEALFYMKNIYDNLPLARRQMQQILIEEGGERYQEIKIGNFYNIGAWLAGDGDGNPNANAEALEMNIDDFQNEIKKLYIRNLELIGNSNTDEEFKNQINQIIGELPSYTDPLDLIKNLQILSKNTSEAKIIEQIEDLIYRVENFGFHYAKIDIRHDASDINTSVAEILFTIGKIDKEAKDQLLDDLQNGLELERTSSYLSECLSEINENPDEIFAKLQNRFDQANDKDKKALETTLRIFGRLQIVAKNPNCSEKLIIAECKNQANALGAMFLLKISGNSINKSGSMNIVTLSESADDLISLPKNIEALLENETYRKHVISNGKLYYMIAKSDTQRRDGPSAHYAQELPLQEVTALFSKLTSKYPELQNVKLIPFNGGGHALQRGGGRIDEIPNVSAKAQARGLYWSGINNPNITILSPVLTTQGYQNGILFSASNTNNFLESYFSQTVYAQAKMSGFIDEPEVLDKKGVINEEATIARENRKLYFETAREFYRQEIITIDSPINVLFRNGPWAIVSLLNASSRPNKRVESNIAPQLTDQRAIGSEAMCSYSGTQLISWYSARIGLQKLVDKNGLKAATSMYDNDKSTRDSFRAMAMSLFMTDFDISWNMMIGSSRPEIGEIRKLAALYKGTEFYNATDELKNKITLAHIEIEAIETAKLIYQIIVDNKSLPKTTAKELSDETAPKELLKILWPNLATEIENREEKLKFCRLVEARLTANLSETEKRNPKNQQTKNILKAFGTTSAGEGTPTSPMLTFTKHIGERPSLNLSNLKEDLVKQLSIIKSPLPKTKVDKLKGNFSAEQINKNQFQKI